MQINVDDFKSRQVADMETDMVDYKAATAQQQKEFKELMKEIKIARDAKEAQIQLEAEHIELKAAHQTALAKIEVRTLHSNITFVVNVGAQSQIDRSAGLNTGLMPTFHVQELQNNVARVEANAELNTQEAVKKAQDEADAAATVEKEKSQQLSFDFQDSQVPALHNRLDSASFLVLLDLTDCLPDSSLLLFMRYLQKAKNKALRQKLKAAEEALANAGKVAVSIDCCSILLNCVFPCWYFFGH